MYSSQLELGLSLRAIELSIFCLQRPKTHAVISLSVTGMFYVDVTVTALQEARAFVL